MLDLMLLNECLMHFFNLMCATMFNVSVNDTVQLIGISINHLMEDYL